MATCLSVRAPCEKAAYLCVRAHCEKAACLCVRAHCEEAAYRRIGEGVEPLRASVLLGER